MTIEDRQKTMLGGRESWTETKSGVKPKLGISNVGCKPNWGVNHLWSYLSTKQSRFDTKVRRRIILDRK